MVRKAKLSKMKGERIINVRSKLSDGWGRNRRKGKE